MGLEITAEAIEVLRRSLSLSGVDPATGGVRLRGAKGLGGGFDVQVELADRALEGETTVEKDGLRIFVDQSVSEAVPEAVVALDPPHEIIVVRPAEPS